uniref:Receptor-mediated endocytosis protein 6 n=1 Tax=Globodera pallida TaxID=36090 RepID=A0A183BKM8_GLOPA
MELDSQAKQQQTECNANKETSVSSMELGAPPAEAMPTLEATNGGDVGSVVVGGGGGDEGSLNAMIPEQSGVATRQTARSGGGTPKGNAPAEARVDSLDQSEDDSQAEELVVKEECTFPQDEYMEDDELQLVDQHNADSHEGTAEPKDVPQKVDEQQNSGAIDEDPAKHIQTPEEMKRLILSQGQLKRLQTLDFDQFHEAVVGFYVRVNYQGLPSKFSTTIFIDQIVDVLEAESFQHLWLKRRLRLRRLGDYSLDKVLPSQNVKNDQDIVSWFSFIEAKEEIAPTIGFVHQKENDLAQASKILDQTESVRKEEKVAQPIKKDNLMQIALSPTMLRLLAKLDFERFRDTVVGCFVFMPCISKDKPTECQYHVIEVKNVIHGPREYKVSITFDTDQKRGKFTWKYWSNLISWMQAHRGNSSTLAWMCRHEQEILRQLINSDLSVSPGNCCQLISNLNSSNFIEAHKVLNQHAAELSHVFKLLMGAPRAVAIFLNAAERISAKYSTEELGRALFNVLYAFGPLDNASTCPKSGSEKIVAEREFDFLTHLQILLRRVFLTAALHEPIMYLLTQDELFLDIDPSKSPIRIPQAERLRRFGSDQNSKSYKEKVAQHRRMIVDKLVLLTEKFVSSILNAMPSFPRSITWLVGQMYTALIEKRLISREEAALICTDLIFTYFLCTAVINPEPLGIISDTPISHIARFNLMQVGQILQTLAILPYEQRFPAYFGEILLRLNKESMMVVMNIILNSNPASIETIFPVHVADSSGTEIYVQPAFVGTLRELNVFQSYLKSPAIDEITDSALRKSLKNMLKRLPDEFFEHPSDMLFTPEQSPASLNSNRLKSFADKVQNAASRGHQRLMQTSSVSNFRSVGQRGNNFPASSSVNFLNENWSTAGKPPSCQEHSASNAHLNFQNVLILPIPDRSDPIGMDSEGSIMELFRRLQSKRRKLVSGEKKTRFLTTTESIVSDRTATDVVSDEDEEEGLDDAAAGSSVSSSNDNAADEVEDISTLPDNFSDVVPISANVSGRGSPSLSGGRLSGRETPFSGNAPEHNSESATICSTIPAIATQPVEPRRTLPTIPTSVRKQNTEGLEEKFGDETVSLVSDSWSTDVVASDNEGLNELRSTDPSAFGLTPNAPTATASVASTAAVSAPFVQQQNTPKLNNYAVVNRHGNNSNSNNPSASVQDNNPQGTTALPLHSAPIESQSEEEFRYYDSINLTRCRAFLDAKRKLRLVLSWTTNLPYASQSEGHKNGDNDKALSNGTDGHSSNTAKSEADSALIALQQFLMLLLAEAVNSRDRKQSAQIREVQRCLSIFEPKGVRILLRTMREEHRKRTAFHLYLQQSRLTLLQLEFCLNRMNKRIRRVKSLTSECLIEMLVRFSLQKKEQQFLQQFLHDFQQLNVQDEKIDLVESHLSHLYEQLVLESMWRSASIEDIEYARKCLERSLMGQIYVYALFPNGDADYYRDEVLYKSIQRLSDSIMADHPELAIPKNLYAECPWPSAQAELSIINAYKSPRDKMACISRCCETIENLITLSSGRSAASADDILPILVFVLIKANPPALLSNLQFIEGFYGKRMQGSEAYWWTQVTKADMLVRYAMPPPTRPLGSSRRLVQRRLTDTETRQSFGFGARQQPTRDDGTYTAFGSN